MHCWVTDSIGGTETLFISPQKSTNVFNLPPDPQIMRDKETLNPFRLPPPPHTSRPSVPGNPFILPPPVQKPRAASQPVSTHPLPHCPFCGPSHHIRHQQSPFSKPFSPHLTLEDRCLQKGKTPVAQPQQNQTGEQQLPIPVTGWLVGMAREQMRQGETTVSDKAI